MRFLPILLSLLLAAGGFAADLQVNIRNHTAGPVANRRVTLKLQQPGPVVQGPWLIAGDYLVQRTDTNGLTTFSNVLAGDYSVTLYGSPERSFVFTVPDTTATLNVATLTGSNSTPSYYTAAQVDALVGLANLAGQFHAWSTNLTVTNCGTPELNGDYHLAGPLANFPDGFTYTNASGFRLFADTTNTWYWSFHGPDYPSRHWRSTTTNVGVPAAGLYGENLNLGEPPAPTVTWALQYAFSGFITSAAPSVVSNYYDYVWTNGEPVEMLITTNVPRWNVTAYTNGAVIYNALQ